MARSHEGLYDQANQTVSYLTSDVLMRIGITGPILDWYNSEFLSKHTRFNTAFENWRNPAERTRTKAAALAEAETDFRKVYRQFYNGYMKSNPLVTDEDLVGAGMPKRSTGGKKPAPKPHTRIRVTAKPLGSGRVGFQYGDEETPGSPAKPDGVHGAEMVYAILDTPPVDWSQLTHSVFFTRTPAELTFAGDERGRKLYFAMRWENTRGEKGPWNDIDNIIIP
jgi:hypothetical protein